MRRAWFYGGLILILAAAAPAAAQLLDADRLVREQLQRDYQQQQQRAERDYDAKRAQQRAQDAERELSRAQHDFDAARGLENAPTRAERDEYRQRRLDLDAARRQSRDVRDIMAPWY